MVNGIVEADFGLCQRVLVGTRERGVNGRGVLNLVASVDIGGSIALRPKGGVSAPAAPDVHINDSSGE